MSITPEVVKELTITQWRELRKGIKLMALFAKMFPGGIKEILTLTKKSAKSQIKSSALKLFQPILNIIDQTAADITKELGINTSITEVENMVASVLNSFGGFISVLIKIFTDLDDDKNAQNLQNLIGWILFFLGYVSGLPRPGPGGGGGIVLPF